LNSVRCDLKSASASISLMLTSVTILLYLTKL
jgi:hypothetical protein